MNAATPPSPTRHRRGLLAIAAAVAMWMLVGLAALVILTWGVLHGIIVPRIGEWRPQLERLATQTLGVPVTIGAIQAEPKGPIPAIELRDVRLFDRAGREALHLPKVLTALSITSLWQGGFEQLVLENPKLAVRRTSDYRIEVAGLSLSSLDSNEPGAMVNWFFSQAEFAIRHGTLEWTDDTRPQAPTLTLNAVDLVVRNPGVQHQIRLDATPPTAWGSRFSLQGHWRQPLWETAPGQWRHWSGTLFGSFPQVDLRELRLYVSTHADLGAELREGAGAMRVWLDMQRGVVTQATTDLALRTVSMQLGHAPAPLQLDNLAGRLDMVRGDRRLEIATQRLTFTTREGQVWPGGNARVTQVLNDQNQTQQVLVQGDHLDLTALRQLARHLPLLDEHRNWLDRLQPAGLVREMALDWAAPLGNQTGRWKIKADLERLHLDAGSPPTASTDHPHPLGRPGVHNLDLHIEADQTGGRAEATILEGFLEFPGLFDEPRVTIDSLKSPIVWQTQGEHWDVQLANLRLSNADAQGEAQIRWQTGDPAQGGQHRLPGVLELSAKLQRANGAQVQRYLPLTIPATVRHYLRDAIPKATARDATFHVKGNLKDFPFGQTPNGRFTVHAKLSDAELNYAPYPPAAGGAWPGLQRLEAELDIDRTTLHLRNISAVVHGQPLLKATKGQADIADYTHDARLRVQARATGPASEALAFVNRSPLRAMTGEVLAQASIGGNADIGFKLDIPLNHTNATQVEGQWTLAGNDLQITPDTPRLENTSANLTFTESGFTVSRASARVLGGDLRFDGGMKNQGGEPVIQFRGQGTATAAGLRTANYLNLPLPLTRSLQGSAPYQLQLGFRQGHPEMVLTSTLQGMALDWPAPLGKAAGSTQALRYEQRILPSTNAGDTNGLRDRVTLDLGALALATFERQWRGSTPQITRGYLRLQSPGKPPLSTADLPVAGVHADVALETLDLDRWAPLWSGESAGTPVSNRYWPTTLRLQTDTVVHGGRAFHNVLLGGTQEGGIWRTNVQSREANGYVEYRPNVGTLPGRVYARLAQLTLNPSMTTGMENLLDQNPTAIPALDVEVKDFELNGRKLGQLNIEATNRGGTPNNPDAAREWRLTRLNLTLPEATLDGSGNWASTVAAGTGSRGANTRRTALTFKLDIRDSGALLKRFGMPDAIRGGKGTLQGAVGWLGSPASIHYPSLGGQLALDLERGQFLKAEPGIAKLLGVLSLQSLPRRLVLDFKDVFSEGFAFDFVRGDVKVEQGVATTNNLQMKGVTAAVLLEGSADLARETQDITAVVIPELNAGTASLLASAINPAVGLGTFLAQFLLRQPLQDAATQQFHVTGTWADPKVEKITRRAVTREGTSP